MVRDLGCRSTRPNERRIAQPHPRRLFADRSLRPRLHLDTLLFQEHRLFEYWAHAASIVLTEDYPIHNLRMREYAKTDDAWNRRIRTWMLENKKLHDSILRELKRRGPLPSRELEDHGAQPKDWVVGLDGWAQRFVDA